jgi:hypothetical protein
MARQRQRNRSRRKGRGVQRPNQQPIVEGINGKKKTEAKGKTPEQLLEEELQQRLRKRLRDIGVSSHQELEQRLEKRMEQDEIFADEVGSKIKELQENYSASNRTFRFALVIGVMVYAALFYIFYRQAENKTQETQTEQKTDDSKKETYNFDHHPGML